MSTKDDKQQQLGMSTGAARNKLQRLLMFHFVQKLDLDKCHQCGETIKSVKELSTEHKTPWLHSDDPVSLYFDIENIAFSHLSCNSASSRPRPKVHGTKHRYGCGCRCEECRKANKLAMRKYRSSNDT